MTAWSKTAIKPRYINSTVSSLTNQIKIEIFQNTGSDHTLQESLEF